MWLDCANFHFWWSQQVRCGGVEDAVCPLLRLSPTPVLSPHSDQRPNTAPGHRLYVRVDM